MDGNFFSYVSEFLSFPWYFDTVLNIKPGLRKLKDWDIKPDRLFYVCRLSRMNDYESVIEFGKTDHVIWRKSGQSFTP